MANELQAGTIPGAVNLRPLLLLLGVAGAAAAGVAILLWWREPTWSLLYGNLGSADANQVLQSLQSVGIEYQVNEGNGTIMVPAEQVHNARLQLASQGLPENATGLDLLNQESGLGVSQFMESARYQYALEGELARTIGALRGVQAARVHLALAQQSAFVRDRKPSSASVLLQLKPGGRLENEQVQAIVHLVASSIPELDARAVTVVDQQGRLLSAPGSSAAAVSAERFELAHRIEESYITRIEELLQPMVGVGRVRAQVTVDVDAGASEESREQYQPQSAVVRSEQTSEQAARGGAADAGGVPGALSNQPPSGGTVAPTGDAAPAAESAAAVAAAAGSSSRQATRNFEIDRTMSYTREPGGRIRRVAVAVLLDNVRKIDADGKQTAEPLSAAQLEDVTRLVRNAVGFDGQRGDTVSVVNAPFHSETAEVLVPEVVPIWQRPWVQSLARLGIGAVLLLLLILSVIKPLIRNLTASSAPLPGAMAGALAGGGEAAAQIPAQLAPATASAYEQQLAQARTLVTQDPKRVAQVVRNWVSE